MNWLLIAVLGILALFAILGLSRGLIKTIFMTCSMIVAILAAVFISPFLHGYLQENAKVTDFLTEKVYIAMDLSNLSLELPDSAEYVDAISIPDNFKVVLAEKIEDSDFFNAATEQISDRVCEFIVNIILYTFSYIAVFVITLFLLAILGKALNIISKLPVIKQANKLAGLLLGLIQGLLIVWTFFILLTMLSSTGVGNAGLTMIAQNDFLSFLYNNNVLMSFLTNKISAIF